MKRGRLILALSVFVILGVYLASAQNPTEDIKLATQGAIDFLRELFETILGPGPTGTVGGEAFSYIWARVLFLLIVFVVCWGVVSKIPFFSSSIWMVVILSGAVALLSTRFLLQPEWIQTILLPYSVFGVAVTALLPLIIYFFFVEGIDSKILRKMMWIFAAVVFVGLWISRSDELTGSVRYVYPAAGFACLIFFSFDGTIQRAYNRIKAERSMKPGKYIKYTKLLTAQDEAAEAYAKLLEKGDATKAKAMKQHLDTLSNTISQLMKD